MALDIYQGSVADETGRYGLMLNVEVQVLHQYLILLSVFCIRITGNSLNRRDSGSMNLLIYVPDHR